MITPGLLPSRLLALSCSCGPLEFFSLTVSQSNNITALIEYTVDSHMKQRGIFPLEDTTALCLYLSIFWRGCCVDCTESLLRLIWQLRGLFWLDDKIFLATNATHICSEMSQYRALQEHNWSDLLSLTLPVSLPYPSCTPVTSLVSFPPNHYFLSPLFLLPV